MHAMISLVQRYGGTGRYAYLKVIISGGAGFIGAHAAVKLLEAGHSVVCFDNLSRQGSSLNLDWLRSLKGDFTFQLCELTKQEEVENLFAAHSDAQAVIHLAAQV